MDGRKLEGQLFTEEEGIVAPEFLSLVSANACATIGERG
jgi:hypothetical protein